MKNKFIAIAAPAMIFTASAGFAGTTGFLQQGGSNVGTASTRATGLSAVNNNPAAAAYLLRDETSIRTGYLFLPSVGFEVGPVDNFIDDIEEFGEELDRLEEDENATEDDARAVVARFNPILEDIGEAAYFNLDLQQQVPVLPVVFRAFGGAVTLNAEAELRTQIRVLTDVLQVVDDGDESFSIETDTAGFIQTGQFLSFSAGYSRNIELSSPALAWLPLPADSSLVAGARLNLTQGTLARAIARFDDDEDDDSDESAIDRLEDNYKDNEESTFGVGLDVGMLWHHKNVFAGATLYNLIPRKFEFGDLGVNCGSISDPVEQEDCNVAAGFSDRIQASGDHTESLRLNIEGGIAFPDTGWQLSGSIDANKVESVVGDDYQWANITGSYDPNKWWLPGLAVGYKTNLAGSKQDYLTLGVNLFSMFSLNISYGLESAEIDGSSVNRSAAIAIGFERPL